jgi:hypothetical protein
MRIRMWNGLLVAAFVWVPASAFAQCGMMSEGGHQHDASRGHQHEQESPQGVDKKAKRNAQKLLDDPRGRDALLEAVLEDATFTGLLLERLSNDPKWFALLSERVRIETEFQAADRDDSETAPAPAPPAPTYPCPMHPTVVSDRPGECPQCGMSLERIHAE